MRSQRLANYFPDWSKVRSDPSSFGARFLSVFSEAFEYNDAEAVKLRDEFRLLKSSLGPSFFYHVDLDTADVMTFSYGADGTPVAVYPTLVEGTHPDAVVAELTRVDTLEELLRGPALGAVLLESAVIDNPVIWQSSWEPDATLPINVAERLLVSVTGSTEYIVRRPTRNRLVSNRSVVIVRGLDLNGNTVTEHVQIPDDGLHYTSNIFGAVTEVLIEGFDGTVEISAAHDSQSKLTQRDPYRQLTTIDRDGPMCLELVGSDPGSVYPEGLDVAAWVIAANSSSLIYKIPVNLFGSDYRDGTVEGEQYEHVAQQMLLDTDGVYFLALDFCIDPDTTQLVVLGDDGRIHYFDHHLGDFSPPDTEADPVSSMSLVPFNYYVGVNGTVTISTWFRQVLLPVLGVTIKEVSPSGEVQYLQAGHATWGAGVYEFSGINTSVVANTWQDFRFQSQLQEIGQYDYYVTIRYNGTTQTNVSSVLVDTLRATSSFLPPDQGGLAPTSVWFTHDGRLALASTVAVQYYQPYRDVYLADPVNQRLYFSDEFTDVSVTV